MLFAASAILSCALLILGGSDSNNAQADMAVFKLFAGTWLNASNDSTQPFEKVEIREDCSVKMWVHSYSPKPWDYTYKLKKTWTDKEGRAYCQYFYQCRTCRGLGLMRVDKARKLLEMNQKMGLESDIYPDLIEQKSPSAHWSYYMSFRRQ